MSRTARLLSLLLLVLGLAISAREARADFQYLSASDAANIVTTVGSGSFTTSDGGTLDHALRGAPDGITVTYTATSAGTVLRLRLNFDVNVSNPGLILYGLTDAGTGVTITEIAWGAGSYSASMSTSTTIETTNVPNSATTFRLSTPFNSYSPAFTPGANPQAFVFFSLNSGDTLTLDAVSNPEPGTSALFALGAGAFLVARMRRRRAVRSGGSST